MSEARFLLDANTCIHLLEGDAPLILERVQRYSPGEVVTSVIVMGEVLIGAGRKEKIAEARRLFERIAPIPFDTAAAIVYAGLPCRRGSSDRLVAAHTLALGLTLVTNNEADFVDIPDLPIENWTR